jgi:hypothetical protein
MFRNMILKALGTIIDQATPEIRQDVTNVLDSVEEKAKATPNPFDDLLIDLLRGVIGL